MLLVLLFKKISFQPELFSPSHFRMLGVSPEPDGQMKDEQRTKKGQTDGRKSLCLILTGDLEKLHIT